MKKRSTLCLAAALCLLLSACGSFGGGGDGGNAGGQTASGVLTEDGQMHFDKGDFTITLPGDYRQQDSKVYTYSFTGGSAPVVLDVLKEPYDSFTEATGGMSLYDYANEVMTRFGFSGELATDEMDNTYFAYTERSEETNFFYYTVLKQGGGAFWTVRFRAPGSQAGLLLTDFAAWAAGATFGASTRFIPDGMQLVEKEGVTLILPDSFTEEEAFEDVDYFFRSEDAGALVYVVRQAYDALAMKDFNGGTAASDYALAMRDTYHPNGDAGVDGRGNAYYLYTSSSGLTYWTAVKKGADAFWLCRFVCSQGQYDAQADSFSQWAASVETD